MIHTPQPSTTGGFGGLLICLPVLAHLVLLFGDMSRVLPDGQLLTLLLTVEESHGIWFMMFMVIHAIMEIPITGGREIAQWY